MNYTEDPGNMVSDVGFFVFVCVVVSMLVMTMLLVAICSAPVAIVRFFMDRRKRHV